MKEERIGWIDNCRGCAIILVILGHCVTRMGSTGVEGIINLMIYSFHMPLFFFISGINLRVNCSLKEFIVKKVKGILLPGYFFMVFLLLYKVIDTHGDILAGRNLEVKDFYYCFCMTNKSIINEYWFLPALFTGGIVCFLLVKKGMITMYGWVSL